MATNRQFFEWMAEQLSGLEEISFRPMMGEYIVYFRGKIVGGIYDDCLMIKPVKAAERLLPDAPGKAPHTPEQKK